MSKIHYFPRYSSKENTVTNNTLLLIARIYDYSPSRASAFLTDLTGEEIELGVEIQQQTRVENSIPDGGVIQRSFKVLIESKVDSPVDANQLLNHAGGFQDEAQKILILLTKQSITKAKADSLRQVINEKYPSVVFKNITYEDVLFSANKLFKDFEYEMAALVEDYREYLNDTKLFDQSKYLMRVVPCGRSIELNKKYGIYFHSKDRNTTEHSYIGVYANRSVQCLWKVDSIFEVSLKGDILTKKRVDGRDTTDYDEKIKAMIRDAKTECGYEVATGNLFFCGQPFETDFKKSTSGGIMAARYINLKEVLGNLPVLPEPAEIAKLLMGREWPVT